MSSFSPLHGTDPHPGGAAHPAREHAPAGAPGMRRRQLLGTVWAAALAPSLLHAAPAGPGRVVVLFLRGAYDGLSALVPWGDARYAQLRDATRIAAPGQGEDSALALDKLFGLHPALAPLLPLWQQGVLGVLPCAGSPDPTRSHFDAQLHWELGTPGRASGTQGWLNRLAAQQQGTALGVGEANPRILAGSAPVQRVAQGAAAERAGAVGNDRAREALMRLYPGEDEVARSFRAGAQSRLETAQMLSEDDEGAMQGADAQRMAQASNGARSAQSLLLDAQHLATLMRRNPALRLGFLSAGGWDTHANQGAASGALARNLASLAQALVALRQELRGPQDLVLVMSEFGRTCAENGTRGTDHGHGNALWLLGNAVQGGRWHGQWSGLDQASLYEGRDLPVHHDFRAVLAQALQASLGCTGAQLDALFPGFAWDRRLDGLMRRG